MSDTPKTDRELLLLTVERLATLQKTVDTWAGHFTNHLSEHAKAEREQRRLYLRVALAAVAGTGGAGAVLATVLRAMGV